MLYSTIFFAASVGLAAAQVQTGNYTIDPNSVDSTTRANWCRAETNTCPVLCGGNLYKSNTCTQASTIQSTLAFIVLTFSAVRPYLHLCLQQRRYPRYVAVPEHHPLIRLPGVQGPVPCHQRRKRHRSGPVPEDLLRQPDCLQHHLFVRLCHQLFCFVERFRHRRQRYFRCR